MEPSSRATTLPEQKSPPVTCRLLERNADKEYIRAHLKELPRVFSDLNEQHWAYWYAMEASNGHDYTKSGNAETWLRTYP